MKQRAHSKRIIRDDVRNHGVLHAKHSTKFSNFAVREVIHRRHGPPSLKLQGCLRSGVLKETIYVGRTQVDFSIVLGDYPAEKVCNDDKNNHVHKLTNGNAFIYQTGRRRKYTMACFVLYFLCFLLKPFICGIIMFC